MTETTARSPVLERFELGRPWATLDPFLFCMHHLDHYPEGNGKFAPKAPLTGRNIGQDFSNKDGWSMYHGQSVPGFPRHPHRGFETITLARQGFIDHADSTGATARFGDGDVQWMTAGGGIEHSEMFPLIHTEKANTGELFQIWLNLPRASKRVEPHFTMMWNEEVPTINHDDDGKSTEIRIVAGSLDGKSAVSPPPDSWASNRDAEIAIYTIRMQAGATWTLPSAKSDDTNRVLYFFSGDSLTVAGVVIDENCGIRVNATVAATLVAGDSDVELLVLQGRPIGEPVVQHGPFVMNTTEEIQQTFADYRRGAFGQWPWPSHAPTHAADKGRFALHSDGRHDEPRGKAARPGPPR